MMYAVPEAPDEVQARIDATIGPEVDYTPVDWDNWIASQHEETAPEFNTNPIIHFTDPDDEERLNFEYAECLQSCVREDIVNIVRDMCEERRL